MFFLSSSHENRRTKRWVFVVEFSEFPPRFSSLLDAECRNVYTHLPLLIKHSRVFAFLFMLFATPLKFFPVLLLARGLPFKGKLIGNFGPPERRSTLGFCVFAKQRNSIRMWGKVIAASRRQTRDHLISRWLRRTWIIRSHFRGSNLCVKKPFIGRKRVKWREWKGERNR